MQDAVIKDGKLFCPICHSPLGKVRDCSLITVNGENYTQFIPLKRTLVTLVMGGSSKY